MWNLQSTFFFFGYMLGDIRLESSTMMARTCPINGIPRRANSTAVTPWMFSPKTYDFATKASGRVGRHVCYGKSPFLQEVNHPYPAMAPEAWPRCGPLEHWSGQACGRWRVWHQQLGPFLPVMFLNGHGGFPVEKDQYDSSTVMDCPYLGYLWYLWPCLHIVYWVYWRGTYPRNQPNLGSQLQCKSSHVGNENEPRNWPNWR